MIEIDNRTNQAISLKHIHSIADSLTQRDIELILCDNETIQQLNSKYRQKQSATDVLSFPLEGELPGMPLGSIVISLDRVNEKSTELGHTPEEELTLLFTHGLLHLMGYDHEIDTGEMRHKEREIIESFELPDSLIIRTEVSVC